MCTVLGFQTGVIALNQMNTDTNSVSDAVAVAVADADTNASTKASLRMSSVSRRGCLLAGAGALLGAWPAWGLQRESLANPLRLGCDEALVNSGLASAWQRAFARDTGVVVSLIAEPATRILEMLNTAEVDMSLTNVPDIESFMADRGLAHDRIQVAVGGFLVVGPEVLQKALQAKSTRLGQHELMPLLAASETPFLTRADDSGTYHFERSLWAPLQVTPSPSWYFVAQGTTPVWLQARDMVACTMVERGVWERIGPKSGLTVWSDNSQGWSVEIHLMRSFRGHHPAARLWIQWVTGPRGRRIAARQPGYQSP